MKSTFDLRLVLVVAIFGVLVLGALAAVVFGGGTVTRSFGLLGLVTIAAFVIPNQ